MRAAIYARVSTRDKGQDVDNQIRQLRKFCAQQDWKVIGTFIDQASGKTSDRDEFKRLFLEASQRKFDVVVFWALDRFSREGALETLMHLRRLSEYGIKYRSLTEPFLDSTNGIVAEIMTPLLATLARQERIRLSERTRAGLERARAQGKRLGRPRLIVNRARAVRLQEKGHSLGQIAKALAISKTSVHRLLNEGAAKPKRRA